MSEPAHLDHHTDADGDHRIRTIGANGRILMATTEGYRNQTDARHAVTLTAAAILVDPNHENDELIAAAIDTWIARHGQA